MKFIAFISILVVLASTSMAYAEEYTIDIPFGAYNPELNTPTEVWYDPPKIFVTTGDTITWYNGDIESHTITSGQGSGRFGWMNDNFGTVSDIFDSNRVMPEDSWSFTFGLPGTFPYFCTIHPWMEGVVIVENEIPDYPHDVTGKVLEFPLIQYTPDRNIEVDLTWHPPILKTHEKIQFIYQFYDPNTNSNLANMNYNFIIFQNKKQIFIDSGKNQIGGDFRNFVFDESGPITIRIEGIHSSSLFSEDSVTVSGNVENKDQRSVNFTTIVYDNPDKTTHEDYNIKPAQRLTIYYELALVFILIPAVLFILALLWLKKKPKNSDRINGAVRI